MSKHLEKRLDEIRGNAPNRSPNVRALAGFAQHTDCRLATAAFSAGVDLDRLLSGTTFAAPFGQSPFAIARGNAFENMLRKDNYQPMLNLLRALPGFPAEGARVTNLRVGFPSGSNRMPLRAQATEDLLRRIIRRDSDAPHLIDGAVLSASIGGRKAHFEADAIAALAGSQLRVGEVKSFPKVDDRVDPDKLGAALDQVAIYILLSRWLIAELGGDPELLVPDRALLITPRNVGLTPTLSQQSVGSRIRRASQVLSAIPAAGDVAASVPVGMSFGTLADTKADEAKRLDALNNLADRVGTAYSPSCLSTCGNAKFCRSRAFGASSPCLTGPSALRLLPGISTINRAAELTRGVTPVTSEKIAAPILARAGRLYDATVGASHTRPTANRRPA